MIALPFGIAWFFSPFIAWIVSQPSTFQDSLDLSSKDEKKLRSIARRTWLYYATFVNAQNNYLPPDNFQEDPEPLVAQRTSPTNIGVYLLSIIAARDFGWIGFEETITRIECTLRSLTKMEKFRGHLYNWYETDTLRPLLPTYVSTVDSGNLAGHLVTLSSALSEWAEKPHLFFKVIEKAYRMFLLFLKKLSKKFQIINPIYARYVKKSKKTSLVFMTLSSLL